MTFPFSRYEPDVPPASPSAYDDEFTAGTLDAKWSEWDPAPFMTVSMNTARERVELDGSGNGTPRLAGIYQAVPGSEYAFYAKVHLHGALNRAGIGLFVSQDVATNPNTAKCAVAYHVQTAAPPSSLSLFGGQYTSFSATVTALLPSATVGLGSGQPGGKAYIRVRMNGAVWFIDFSDDGVDWTQFYTATLAYTPTHFGIVFTPFENTVPFKGSCDFFRVFSGAGTSGINATEIGRYITYDVT